MTLVSTVGGAGGPLYGTFFLQLGGGTAGKTEIELGGLRRRRWRPASPGSSAWARPSRATRPCSTPSSRRVTRCTAALDGGNAPADALAAAVAAAEQGMLATIPLVARKGRASYLGERSAGHQDPGATSSHLLLKAAADTWFQA